jgi:mannose-6-phosphate isomerase-like protein (cupin superfamily)
MVIEEERANERAVVMKAGEGTPIWFLGNLMVLKATAETTNGAFGLLESLVRAGSAPPLHIHHREDETFWVLEGAVQVQCGDESYDAPAGSYIFLPRGIPHTYRVVSETHARLLTLLTPGGGEMFFVEGGRPADSLTLPPAGPPDIAKLEQAAKKHGSEILGPPPVPSAR